VIVGSALGSVIILILLLTVFFLRRRRQRKTLTEAVTFRQKQQFSRAMLLAGEDLDDDIPSRSYQSLTFPSGYDSPREVNSLSMRSLHSLTPSLQSPRLLRSRGSGTGSIFHEGVWPPPGEHSRLVDPSWMMSWVPRSPIPGGKTRTLPQTVISHPLFHLTPVITTPPVVALLPLHLLAIHSTHQIRRRLGCGFQNP